MTNKYIEEKYIMTSTKATLDVEYFKLFTKQHKTILNMLRNLQVELHEEHKKQNHNYKLNALTAGLKNYRTLRG